MKKLFAFHTFLAAFIICAPLQCQWGRLPNVSNERITVIREKLHKIPADELEQLKGLFKHLFINHGFAYTLFGDKPISCDCSFHEHFDGLFQGSKEQFRIWEKYSSLFPSNNYIFLFCENDLSEKNKYEITFINKKVFKINFEKYRDRFIDLFGKSITAEKLLDLLIEKKTLWKTPIKEREDLMGILLGYGKTNAELYQRREEIEKIIGNNGKQQTREKTQETHSKKWIQRIRKPSPGFSSFEEELQDIEQRLGGSYPDNPQIRRMSLPGFAADYSDQETIELIKKYKQQRRQILEKYHNRCVLEASLLQLCSD